MSNKKLLIVDAYGFIFRAYHSLPPLSTESGIPVGAVYGFGSMLLKLLGDHDFTHIAVALDSGSKNFRHKLYEPYKANRIEAPAELIPQFPIIREITKAFALPAFEKIGYEADDVIASLVKVATEYGMEVTIVSSDKDLMQLVCDPIVSMFDPFKNKIIREREVIEKFGVPPNNLLDLFAMVGDSSDNIPGIPSIGPKTAALLLGEYGTLEGVIENCDNIKQEKRRKTIADSIDLAIISKKLISLDSQVPLEINIDKLKFGKPDVHALLAFFNKYNFKALSTRAEKLFGIDFSQAEVAKTEEKKNLKLVTSKTQLEEAASGILANKFVYIDYLINEKSKLDSLMLMAGDNLYYIPIGDMQTLDMFAKSSAAFSLDDVKDTLKGVLNAEHLLKVGTDLKQFMHKLDSTFSPYEDILQILYIVESGSGASNLANIAAKTADAALLDIKELIGAGYNKKVLSEIDSKIKADYLAHNIVIYSIIHNYAKSQLMKLPLKCLYYDIDQPMTAITYQMEKLGIKLDKELLAKMSKVFEKRLEEISEEIYKIAGRAFNIGSPKQLGEVLFTEMNIPYPKNNVRKYSTDAGILAELAANGHHIADYILEYRTVSKLKSTYTDSLPNQINPKTGRIHTTFSLFATSTGRFSSTDPNLQNIPVRDEEGRKIRKCFVPKNGYKFISADYSQIDLRVLAHFANIDVLIDAFHHGADIHASTASAIFEVTPDQVDANMRRKAKAINFGIVYGISAFGLANQLKISKSQAADYIDAYFRKYPGIKDYMEDQKEFARQHGYVQTLYGRRCKITDINDKNMIKRGLAERFAINAPIQGSTADIVKIAMIKLKRRMPELDMLLQVHDDLLFEVPEDKAEYYSPLIKDVMENAASLKVPLTVSITVTDDWGK